jgi:phage-related minor tail protein
MAIVKGVTAAFTTVTTLWSLATGKATIAQLGLNAAMLLNPIAAVIAVIVALVAGLIFFFTQTKTGQKIWADFTKFLGDAWNNVSKFFSDSWKNITKFFSDGFNNVLNFFKNFRGNILNILSGAGSWLLNIGKNVIDGLLNGLKNGFTAVTSFVSNIGSSVMGGIKKIFGIRSPSREMIKLGEYMMEGLGVGLNDTRNLDRAVANVSDRLSFNASAEYGRGGGFGGAGNTYNITVQAVAPNSEVGRTIVEAINEYERTSGRRFVSV